MAKKGTKSLTFKGYLESSSDLFTSLILVVPLFVIYQIGVLATGGVQNGVDFMSQLLWTISSGSLFTYLGINLGVLLALVGGIYYLKDQGEFNPKIWPFVIVESTLYAICFGTVVILMMSTLGLDALLASGAKEFGVFSSFILSLGAGLYEETVFRLILMGGLFWAIDRVPMVPTFVAAVAAVLISSFLFSGIHYIGPMGDPFSLGSFSFRFFAGVLLAVIFYLRGFAVAVYTHAIYDIIVMVFN